MAVAVLSLSYYLKKITHFCKNAIEEKTISSQYKIEDIITDRLGKTTHIRLNIIPVGFVCPLLTPREIYTDKNLLLRMNPIEAIVVSETVLEQEKNSIPSHEYEIAATNHTGSNIISLRNILTNQIHDITLSDLKTNTNILTKIKPEDLFKLGQCFGIDCGTQKLKQYLALIRGKCDETK